MSHHSFVNNDIFIGQKSHHSFHSSCKQITVPHIPYIVQQLLSLSTIEIVFAVAFFPLAAKQSSSISNLTYISQFPLLLMEVVNAMWSVRKKVVLTQVHVLRSIMLYCSDGSFRCSRGNVANTNISCGIHDRCSYSWSFGPSRGRSASRLRDDDAQH